jgi:hypothetical protein
MQEAECSMGPVFTDAGNVAPHSPGFEPRPVYLVASHYAHYTILANRKMLENNTVYINKNSGVERFEKI